MHCSEKFPKFHWFKMLNLHRWQLNNKINLDVSAFQNRQKTIFPSIFQSPLLTLLGGQTPVRHTHTLATTTALPTRQARARKTRDVAGRVHIGHTRAHRLVHQHPAAARQRHAAARHSLEIEGSSIKDLTLSCYLPCYSYRWPPILLLPYI